MSVFVCVCVCAGLDVFLSMLDCVFGDVCVCGGLNMCLCVWEPGYF